MLKQLQVFDLRNIHHLKISTTRCNVITGGNGSGKTSLLEAVYLLSRGKSFRHHQPKRYITYNQPSTTVHALFTDGSTMAVQKLQNAHTTLRFNGQQVLTQSQLTAKLPTLLIDPSSMDVLDTGTAHRRHLMDWLTFHVKPEFHPQWTAYQKLLRQRNTFLKSKKQLTQVDRSELAAWDKGLADHADLITHYRQTIFALWQHEFDKIIARLLPKYDGVIPLKFVAGYDVDQSLENLLAKRMPLDHQLGYTRIGCHRADIQILWHSCDTNQDNKQHDAKVKEQATHVLSRGEKKLLITALKLSQLVVIDAHSTHMKDEALPIVLLDDVTAELDECATDTLLQTLASLSCQVFITSLDRSIVKKLDRLWPDLSVFHMEQGKTHSVKLS